MEDIWKSTSKQYTKKVRAYKCDLCDKTFVQKKTLQNHVLALQRLQQLAIEKNGSRYQDQLPSRCAYFWTGEAIPQ